MKPAEILSSIISGVAVLLLTLIARTLITSTRDFRRFMAEHAWLIATSLWTRDKVIRIMEAMGMPWEGDPPTDPPRR